MKQHLPSIFKAYDIRGIVGTQLTNEIINEIGKVLGTMTLESGIQELVVGYDGRLTSPELSEYLIDGILSSGCDVYNIGQVTTPMVYFANFELKTYSGIMITGSHNPPEYNGLKMVINKETLAADKITEIQKRITNKNYIHNQQGMENKITIKEKYLKAITSDVKLSRNVKIVVDSGNGVAGDIAPILYRRMGARVLGLNCEVNGNFPNHHPDPSKPENLAELIKAVATTNSEFGLAFDGDGDRLGVVTNDGNIIYPDRQLMLFAASVLDKHPNSKILYDVKSTRLLDGWIKEHNGQPIMCRTGHSFIKQEIQKTGALLAGEMSGHIFFKDRWYGCDDGVYAGARLLELLSQVDNPSELLNALPCTVSTPELNLTVNDGNPHKIIQKLQKNLNFKDALNIITIDGIRVEYQDGFGLVRASNTTPVLVLRFEADNETGLKRIKHEFHAMLKKYVADVNF